MRSPPTVYRRRTVHDASVEHETGRPERGSRPNRRPCTGFADRLVLNATRPKSPAVGVPDNASCAKEIKRPYVVYRGHLCLWECVWFSLFRRNRNKNARTAQCTDGVFNRGGGNKTLGFQKSTFYCLCMVGQIVNGFPKSVFVTITRGIVKRSESNAKSHSGRFESDFEYNAWK